MHQYKVVAILALCLLIANQPAPGQAAAAPAAQGLLPLPERRAAEPVLQGQPGIIHYVQSNVSVPMDGEHEIDLQSAPRRIEAPIQLVAVPASDPDAPNLVDVRDGTAATAKEPITTTTTSRPLSTTTTKPTSGVSGLKTGLLFMTVIMISAGLTINSVTMTKIMRV